MKWIVKNRNVLIFIVVIVIGFIVIRWLMVDPSRIKDKKLGSPSEYGKIPKGWYPDAITKEMYDAISGADSQMKREVAFAHFNMLNKNQKILVYNDWNEKYFDERVLWIFEKYGTLTQALKDEYLLGAEGIRALAALEELNLP